MATARENVSTYIPTLSFTDGFGPLDSTIDWDRDENTGDLILNIHTQNGEHAAGINLNRTAIVDLIHELSKSLR